MSAAGRVTVVFAHDLFVEWLDRQLAAKVGRRKTDTQVAQEAGLGDRSILSRIMTRGERPSPRVCAALADYLGVSVQTMRQRAGYEPIIRDGVLLGELSDEERDEIQSMISTALGTKNRDTDRH